MLALPILLFAVVLAPEAPDVQYRQPQVAAEGRRVAVTFGAGNVIYFAGSTDGGQTFSAPAQVAGEGVLALGNHRGPRVAILGGSIVIAAITGEKGKGQDGDLVVWRSADGGCTWSAGKKLNSVPGAAREGLHALAGGPHGQVAAAWLDLRTKGARLYGAFSSDGGLTWSENRLIYESPDGHICECCHPSALVAADGRIFVMWRNWLGGSRDLYLAVSADGGLTFQSRKLGAGTWPLIACPMDGGGITAAGNTIYTVWRRADAVYLAPAGGAETELGKGKNPALAVSPRGEVYAAWSSGSRLMLLRPGQSEPVVLAGEGAFVAMAGTVAAWEADGKIVLRALE